MRAIGPRPARLTPAELLEPVAALKGVSRAIVEDTLDQHDMVYQGQAMLAEGQLPTEIYQAPGLIGYAARDRAVGPGTLWTLMILPYQTPDAPEPPPRTRGIRLH